MYHWKIYIYIYHVRFYCSIVHWGEEKVRTCTIRGEQRYQLPGLLHGVFIDGYSGNAADVNPSSKHHGIGELILGQNDAPLV